MEAHGRHWNHLYEKKNLKRRDKCLCMTESSSRTLQTNITSEIDSTPMENTSEIRRKGRKTLWATKKCCLLVVVSGTTTTRSKALPMGTWPLQLTCRSNQSILKEITPECSLEGLMLKLKLQSFGHLMRRADSLEKTLMLGKIDGGRRRGRQRMRWLDGLTDMTDMSLNKL